MSAINDRRILFSLGCMIVLFLIALFANVFRIVQQDEQIHGLKNEVSKMGATKPHVIVQQDEKTLQMVSTLSNQVVALTQQLLAMQALSDKMDKIISSAQNNIDIRETIGELKNYLERLKKIEASASAPTPASAPAPAPAPAPATNGVPTASAGA